MYMRFSLRRFLGVLDDVGHVFDASGGGKAAVDGYFGTVDVGGSVAQ
jgi:hypothetical protein